MIRQNKVGGVLTIDVEETFYFETEAERHEAYKQLYKLACGCEVIK